MFSSDDGNKHNIIAEPTSVYYIAEKLIYTNKIPDYNSKAASTVHSTVLF